MFRKNLLISGALFFVLLIPILGVGVHEYRTFDTNITQQVFLQRTTVASLAASAIKLKLDSLVKLDQLYATDPDLSSAVAQANWTKARSIIAILLQDKAHYDYYVDRILLLDASGTVQVAFPGISQEGIGRPDDAISEWYGPIVNNGDASFVSDVYKRSVSPRTNSIEILVPIKQGTVLVGVAELTIPINEFSDFVSDTSIGSTGFIYIVDRNGHIISNPQYPSRGPIVDYSTVSIVQSVMHGESGAELFHNPIAQQDRVVAYQPVPIYEWGVVAQEPSSDAFAPRNTILKDVLYTIISFCLIDLIASSLVFYFLSRRTSPKRTNKKK